MNDGCHQESDDEYSYEIVTTEITNADKVNFYSSISLISDFQLYLGGPIVNEYGKKVGEVSGEYQRMFF